MDIGYLWDEDKYKAVQRKHGVQFREVIFAFEDPNGYEIPDPAGHEDRWMRVGITHRWSGVGNYFFRRRSTNLPFNHCL